MVFCVLSGFWLDVEWFFGALFDVEWFFGALFDVEWFFGVTRSAHDCKNN